MNETPPLSSAPDDAAVHAAATLPVVSASEVEACLRTALEPLELAVRDDSHLHAGHAGAREGRHFDVRISAARFAGLGRVARHRLIYDALRPLMLRGIHALAIDAHAPSER